MPGKQTEIEEWALCLLKHSFITIIANISHALIRQSRATHLICSREAHRRAQHWEGDKGMGETAELTAFLCVREEKSLNNGIGFAIKSLH